jgi:serine/threonine-protein kinase HipA
VGLEQELFTRIAANIVLGNTDDHARNHAALWDGRTLELSPAYDLDPCRPPGWDANQAMAYGRDGERRANLVDLVRSASAYGLTRAEARGTVDRAVTTVRDQWADALDRARLTRAQGDSLFGSRILNPAILAE